jgi:hypothetical protein
LGWWEEPLDRYGARKVYWDCALEHKIPVSLMAHLPDTDLERYYLGMVPEGPELVSLEEHLLWCQDCLERAQDSDLYVDTIRAAIIRGDFDL